MKSFFSALFMFAFCSISYAQNPVVDTHPRSQIYVIDLQSGQETPVNTDAAILFKNALIDLVRTTYRARMVISNVSPEYNNRVFTITQMGVETNVNGYQIVLDHWAQDPAQNINIYTFVYHVDDNTLYFYDPVNQSWLLERIMPNNLFNLRRVAAYAEKFDEELANQQPSDQNGQVGTDASFDLNAPVDADVVTDTPPPPMPEYEQPECPSDGYLWQPGYWAFSQEREDYYWVPGAWVAPPAIGVLWTPPYWGYEGDRYIFHIGYWGDHIGFYGGINYGYGYGGRGYYGGEWRGEHFNYNTAVVRVNTNVIHNTYVNTTVINNVTVNNRSSFNGGRGGVTARPTSAEIVATHERHLNPTPAQNGNQLAARVNPQQFAKGNPGGRPANLASPKVIVFHPQNNSFSKGVNPGIGGKPDQPQVNNPGRPAGQPGFPNRQGNNPGRPAGQPGFPNGQGNNPGRPTGQPGFPNGQGNNPGRPSGQPGFPNRQGNNPGRPIGQPGFPNEQGNNPGRPAGQPGIPNGQGNNPGRPAGQPGFPNRQGNNPGRPTGQPGIPNGQGNNPGRPAGQPGFPNGQGNNPGRPAGQPGFPNGQGNNPGRPAGQPGFPNGQGNNPGRPVGQPANPNGQGNNPGRPAGQPANPPKPVIQQAKPARPAENKPNQQGKPVKQNN